MAQKCQMGCKISHLAILRHRRREGGREQLVELEKKGLTKLVGWLLALVHILKKHFKVFGVCGCVCGGGANSPQYSRDDNSDKTFFWVWPSFFPPLQQKEGKEQ